MKGALCHPPASSCPNDSCTGFCCRGATTAVVLVAPGPVPVSPAEAEEMPAAAGAAAWLWGLADIARHMTPRSRHVSRCQMNQEMRVKPSVDDVAGNICQVLPQCAARAAAAGR